MKFLIIYRKKEKKEYRIQSVKEQINDLTDDLLLDELNELIFVTESVKADKSQSTYSALIALMSVLLASLAILFSTIFNSEETTFMNDFAPIYILAIISAAYFSFSNEFKRKRDYIAVTYFLEKLKYIRKEKFNK